jgi:hypothetical protein
MSTPRIAQLKDSNYNYWANSTSAVLKAKGIFKYVTKDTSTCDYDYGVPKKTARRKRKS